MISAKDHATSALANEEKQTPSYIKTRATKILPPNYNMLLINDPDVILRLT